MYRNSLQCSVMVALLVFGSLPAFAGPAPKPGMGNSRWGANYFPNVPLITHEGKSVHFFDDLIKDKVVAINFIYTSCPDSCPLETSRLAEVQRILGDRVGRDVFMYSITIDPATDTPEVLKKYREKYKVGPGWTFLTGTEANITLLRKKLGLYIQEIQNGTNDHNLSLIIGNQSTGQWMKRSPFENPYVLAQQLGGWLHNFKMPRLTHNNYADAPVLRNISKGESLFRTRCTACHTIGVGDGQARIGPNLLGATKRRDREWLERWLADPEKMLAEKDSIATGLFLAYNKVPMPNLRLNELEVDKILEYIETESSRIEKADKVKTVAAGSGTKALKSCCMKRQKLVLSASDNPSAEKTDTVETVATGSSTKALKPCCMKREKLVLSASDDSSPSVTCDECPENPTSRGGFTTASMIFSSTMGGVFLLLAAVFRRRRL